MSDEIDRYGQNGILSTFTFGTTAFGSYFTSIAMELREQAIEDHVSVEKTYLPPPAGLAGLPTPPDRGPQARDRPAGAV